MVATLVSFKEPWRTTGEKKKTKKKKTRSSAAARASLFGSTSLWGCCQVKPGDRGLRDGLTRLADLGLKKMVHQKTGGGSVFFAVAQHETGAKRCWSMCPITRVPCFVFCFFF